MNVLTSRPILANMAKKTEPPKPTSWDIYRVAYKGKLLGTVEADNAGEAVKKAAHAASDTYHRPQWPLVRLRPVTVNSQVVNSKKITRSGN